MGITAGTTVPAIYSHLGHIEFGHERLVICNERAARKLTVVTGGVQPVPADEAGDNKFPRSMPAVGWKPTANSPGNGHSSP
jgi:hypothetical protein